MFNPILYSVQLLRVYRDYLYTSLLLYLLSCLLAIFYNYKEKISSLVGYMIGFGLSFTFMWICREETIWVVPVIICSIIITALFIIIDKKCDKKVKRLLLYLIPLSIFVIIISVICLLNYIAYGLFTLKQYSGSTWNNCINALTSIKQEENYDLVPISHSTMEKLYEISPAYGELKEYYEETESGRAWADNGEIEGEIEKGWFTWSLIDAVYYAGYYTDAKTANDFYKRLTNEINEAFENGTLEKETDKPSFFTKDNIIKLMKNFKSTYVYQANVFGDDIRLERDDERFYQDADLEEGQIDKFREITGNISTNSKTYNYWLDKAKCRSLEIIAKVYEKLSPYLMKIAILCFALECILFIRKKTRFKNYKELILLFSMFTLYFTRLLVIAYTETSQFTGAINTMYLACTYPIQFGFEVLAIYFILKNIYDCIKNTKENNNLNENIKEDIKLKGVKKMEKNDLELTILMPCLNEAETLEICIKKALKSLKENNIKGEVLIADNGSTDGSQEIAEKNGARVVNVPRRGYGSALIEGTKQAYGKYCIMGDADDSYDFSNIMPYVEKLREGYELVMGNRFKGGIEKGAMPWSHKYIGTPVISFIGRLFYKSKIGDFNCGMRGYDRQAILNLDLKCTGMEYASEMIVQANLNGLKIAEIPTTLKKDGRTRPPHLKSFSDGWRHLKFLLLYSPKWLFLIPGMILMIIGLVGSLAFCFSDLHIASVVLGVHSRLYLGGMLVVGLQMVIFALFAKVYAVNSGMHPKEDKITNFLKKITLEKGLIAGIILTIVGFALSIYSIVLWKNAAWGELNPVDVMPITIPAIYLIIIGVQMAFASFFLGVLNIEYKNNNN